MKKYEYDFERINLTEEQEQMMQMGMGDIESINSILKDIINVRAKAGWEPLYPFSVPGLWFKKEKTTKRKKITKKS